MQALDAGAVVQQVTGEGAQGKRWLLWCKTLVSAGQAGRAGVLQAQT